MIKYRQHYAAQLAASAHKQYDARATKVSNMMHAIEYSVVQEFKRADIVMRLPDVAFKGECPFKLYDYANDYVEGVQGKKDELIKAAFENMWKKEAGETSSRCRVM